MRRFFILTLLLTAAAGPLSAQAPNLAPVQAALESISAKPEIAHGVLGFALGDPTDGKILLQQQGGMTLLPASTMKTVTSAAALGILGEDFTFETVLEHTGTVSGGVLKGDLILRGGGDPTLGTDRYSWGTDTNFVLKKWVDAVKKAGITRIEGNVAGDAGIFEEAMTPPNWVWNDVGNYYGAGACGLTFFENTYYLYFNPGKKAGDAADLVRTTPYVPGLRLINEMKTGAAGSGDNGYVYGSEYSWDRVLRGTVPAGEPNFSIKGAVPDPALWAAQWLVQELNRAGITVSGTATTARTQRLAGKPLPADRYTLDIHRSPKLRDIVYWLNKKSVNLYAEHLLKMCGYKVHQQGTNEMGAKAVTDWWARQGVDVNGLHMMDGSGLSRYNGVTPLQLTTMLMKNTRQPWFKAFYESLPIAGDANCPGTLRNMCKGTAAQGRVHAKSGFIARVRCYAGYVETKSGKTLCFTLMANNYTCSNSVAKDYLESLMVLLAEA